MKNTYKLILIAAVFIFSAVSCKKFLDRPPLTVENDETAWNSEDNLRLYANKYLTDFFPGYGEGWSIGSVLPTFSDDIFFMGNQGNFVRAIPNSSIWSMGNIRSINIMLDRIENRMQNILSTEASNHWTGVGRFYRGLEYADLVLRFGDVPYYDHVVSDLDMDDLYKSRTPRNEVMDAVYDDWKFAFENVRTSDGNQALHRYIVAGMISRYALYEGTWQKYHYNNTERARKFLELAQQTADYLIASGRYDIVTDFRSLFTSFDLNGNKDVVFYRHYDPAVGVTHSVASTHNMDATVAYGPSTALIKSFICVDGEVWQNSNIENSDDFRIDSAIMKRDSRLEGSFYENVFAGNRASYWAINKFLPRDVAKAVAAGAKPNEWLSTNNYTDYPVFRYAEALLNWIEAKAELATIGGAAVSQNDIDITINKIRNRPIAPAAASMGVTKTAPMDLANLPNDPERDPSVLPLLWEIRRERRMEFAFEHSRYQDLKRWKKLDYMDADVNQDILSGGWVDFPEEKPSALSADNKGVFGVVKLDGSVVTYNGNNGNEMKGFYRLSTTNPRLPFLNISNINPYLDPVGRNQIEDYRLRGYELAQTEGWPQ